MIKIVKFTIAILIIIMFIVLFYFVIKDKLSNGIDITFEGLSVEPQSVR